MIRQKWLAVIGGFLVVIGASSAGVEAASKSPFTAPKSMVAGIPTKLDLSGSGISYKLNIEKDGELIASHEGILPASIDFTPPGRGRYAITTIVGNDRWTASVPVFPGVVTILPPLIAIVTALIFRQVVLALFAGVWLGAFFLNDYNVFRSLFFVVDHYVIDSLAGDSGAEHVSIGVFTMMLGGMVGVFSRIGGTQGAVNQISRLATTPRRGQLATWLMGIAVFFDDYTNTLIVGNTMRPITDKLRISREKLSYIVDSTAAPVACIAIITSWIGFEISLVKDAFDSLGVDRNPFTTFLASIPYNFYPILTLLFGFFIAATTRDFGPMLTAEKRARTTGKVLAEDAVPLSVVDKEIAIDMSDRPRWYNAAIPIGVVVFGTFVGLVVTGRSSLIGSGTMEYSILDTIRASDSFAALLWSSLAGCIVAIGLGLVQRLASLSDIMSAWVGGVKSMVAAIIILVLAWGIGAVCTDLNTAQYLVAKLTGVISPGLLPSLIFLIAAAVSFSTGTSWGTMTILTPITIPLAIRIGEMGTLSAGTQESILLGSISAVLAGSVFGDHCSPISDTTIMSSMASGSDHVDHVRTQLPYALLVAGVALVFGYLPAGYNVPPLVSLLLGGVAVFGLVMLLGKREISYAVQE